MKKLFALIIILIGLYGCNPKTIYYSGPIVDMYQTSAGYKVKGQNHVIFYNDSLKRNIDVIVTDNCYANCKKGEWVGFDLMNFQLKQ